MVINAGKYNVSNPNFEMGGTEGVLIIDGVVIQNTPHPKYHILAIDDNGNFDTFVGVDGNTLLAMGYKSATTAFAPIIVDGQKLSNSEINITTGATGNARRQIIAINEEGDYEICSFNTGISYEKSRDLLYERNVQFAYHLDGGGSTSVYVYDQEVFDVEKRPIIDVIVFELE